MRPVRTRLARNPLPAAAALTAVALVVAGCGGGGGSKSSSTSKKSASSSASSGGATLKETATDFKFDNKNPTVKKGKVTINLTNKGGTTHAIEVEGKGLEVKANQIKPGQSTKLTVNLTKPGKYEFYCPVDGHKQLGMKGTLTVQ
jgi:uncharacterized cupredoxin-like copper-binding protein